jgi:hypothetical protein
MLATNDFQNGINEVREYITANLIGKEIIGDKDHMFTGSWGGPQQVTGVIETTIHDGCFVAGVRFKGEDISTLNSGSFMLSTTEWGWEHASARDDELPIPNGKKHIRSMHRAYCLIVAIVDSVGAGGLKGKYIFILDGNGENRRAIEKALDDLGISMSHRPTVITLELNPNVAFANALRFGRQHVRMTSADFRIQLKQNDVCGIERAILLEGHSVLSEFEKDNCIGLYLDYCGSPSKCTPFNKLYKRLPELVGCAITIAKRQPNHAFGCHKRRKLAAPPKYEFERLLEFDHDKVFCDMYVRKKKTQKPCDPIPNNKEIEAKPTKSEQRKSAQRLIGNFVALPEAMWPGSNPGPEFDCVKRINDRLIFRINKTYHCKCALCAIMLDGSQHPTTERFWLTSEQAHALLLV